MHGQLPLAWAKADDFNVYDHCDNKWIDFTSTIFVSNIGHSNSRLISYLKEALSNPLISCYSYPNSIRADYIERLLEFAGPNFTKAFLLSAGTEATEAVLKLMRMHGQKLGKKNPGIICLSGNWHGRTLGAQMLCGNDQQKEWIGYQDPNIHHIPFPYPWHLDNTTPEQFLEDSLHSLAKAGIKLSSDICGIVLETFQGWGSLFYPPEYVQKIRELCDQNNSLLAFDEMQSGFGRTGKNFGYEHYDVTPDLIACGKGMGGGIAISGVLGPAEILDLPTIGNMSSTHSANPIACAAGMAVLDELRDKDLVNESHRKGIYLQSRLKEIKNMFSDRISSFYGKGLIAAVLFKDAKSQEPDPYFTSKVAELCMQRGLLVVHTGRESIKIGPPLTITDDALKEGLEVLEESIRDTESIC